MNLISSFLIITFFESESNIFYHRTLLTINGVVYKTKKPFYVLFEEAKFSFHKRGQVYEKRGKVKVRAWKKAIKKQLELVF